jgi:transcriptional regulatory protein LEU3
LFDLADAALRRQGLLRAYGAASTFITRLLDEDKATDLLLYCPYELLRILWQAMQLISDILRSAYAPHVDSEAGQRLFHAGIAGARHASMENNDMPDRLSVIMAQL